MLNDAHPNKQWITVCSHVHTSTVNINNSYCIASYLVLNTQTYEVVFYSYYAIGYIEMKT